MKAKEGGRMKKKRREERGLKARTKNRRFSQKTADIRRFTRSPGNSNIWRAQETAESRRFSQETEDFRRKPQETADCAPSP